MNLAIRWLFKNIGIILTSKLSNEPLIKGDCLLGLKILATRLYHIYHCKFTTVPPQGAILKQENKRPKFKTTALMEMDPR